MTARAHARHLAPRHLWATAALCCAFACQAQNEDSRLKAAYIFNIAQFTTWPASEAARPLAVCASPAHSLWKGLRELEGKSAAGRAWNVIDGEQGRACDIVVFSAAAAPNAAPPVVPGTLFVVDGARPNRWQGTVTLVEEDAHLRFDIDTREAARAGLKFSSRLLQLARNVL